MHFNNLVVRISTGFGRFSVYTHFGQMCFITKQSIHSNFHCLRNVLSSVLNSNLSSTHILCSLSPWNKKISISIKSNFLSLSKSEFRLLFVLLRAQWNLSQQRSWLSLVTLEAFILLSNITIVAITLLAFSLQRFLFGTICQDCHFLHPPLSVDIFFEPPLTTFQASASSAGLVHHLRCHSVVTQHGEMGHSSTGLHRFPSVHS